MLRYFACTALGLALAVLAGCGSETEPPEDALPDKPAKTPANSTPSPEAPPERREESRDATAETAAAIRELIPAAVGMPPADMEKLGLPDEVPRPSAIDNKSLSLMACCYIAIPKPVNETRWQEFHYTSWSVPSGEALFTELARSQPQGYFSIVQPDRIAGFTCEVKGDAARGAFTIQVPDVCEGTVQYFAQRAADGWQITEFQMPAHAYRFMRRADGTWKWLGLFGDIDEYPPPLQRVSGRITTGGKPLVGGMILFHHEVDNMMTGFGRIDEDGRYTVEVAVGSYHVSLRSTEPPVPEKYTSPGETGLICEVKEGGNSFDLDMAMD